MENNQLKILFLTNVPSPYRVDFFGELGKRCDLTVLYQKESSSERDKKWISESKNTYKSVFLKGINTGVDNSFCPSVIKYLNNTFDAIIICGNASPTEMFAIQWCILKKIPYCLEGDGAFLNKGNKLKDKIKKHLISNACLFFSSCKELDKYYINYGANPSKIVRYRFTSLFERDILLEPVTKEEKEKLRSKLGMKESKIVLAVGQFIHRKGFDTLMKASLLIDKSVAIYIVGGTPTDEYIEFVRKNNLNNIYFEGFKTKAQLINYYKAADVFVLPTREDIWGLVVNEAMACGLPVVTTNRCNAGLELIKNSINGYIISSNDVEQLSDRIMRVLNSSEGMATEVINIVKEYTIENMVKEHMNFLFKLVNKKE